MTDSLLLIFPEAILVLTAVFITIKWRSEKTRVEDWSLALIGTVIALVVSQQNAAHLVNYIILGALIIGLLFDYKSGLKRDHQHTWLALLLIGAAGAIVISSSAHLIPLVLGLEIVSVVIYTLAMFDRTTREARDAGIRMIVPGLVSTGFMLLGCAFYYTGTGTLWLSGAEIAASGDIPGSIGILLIIAGLLLKGCLLPLLLWRPVSGKYGTDYGYAIVAVITASATVFAMSRLMREFIVSGAADTISSSVLLTAFLMCLGGNLLALVQSNVKRMLAFLAVAQVGCMLAMLTSFDADTFGSMFFWLATWAPVQVAAFYYAGLLEKGGASKLSELEGFGWRMPQVSGIFALILLSIAGLPPTAGFMGQLMVYMEAVQSGLLLPVLFVAIVNLAGVFCCLRIIAFMYMKAPAKDKSHRTSPKPLTLPARIGVLATVIIIAVIGVYPAPLIFIAYVAADIMWR